MTFSVMNLARSLADYLAPIFPGVTFFEDPVQQESEVPCMFLQVRTTNISLHPSNRYLRTIGLDLIYLVDFNLPNLQRIYQEAIEKLDECMETFPYTDDWDENSPTPEPEYVLLRAYKRTSNVDEDSAHYNFELRLWVHPPESGTLMQTLTYQEEILNE